MKGRGVTNEPGGGVRVRHTLALRPALTPPYAHKRRDASGFRMMPPPPLNAAVFPLKTTDADMRSLMKPHWPFAGGHTAHFRSGSSCPSNAWMTTPMSVKRLLPGL